MVVVVAVVELILEMFQILKVKTVDQVVVLQLIALVQKELELVTLLRQLLLKEIMEEQLLVLEVVQVVVDTLQLVLLVVQTLVVQAVQEQI
tara:strand:- start:94 stop:366 length:273 start_codon:yes stop_codon:yes gene_type:complete